jgi:cell division septum initiation protein DivIVA
MSVYRVLEKLEAYVHEGTWLPAGFRLLSEERLIEFVEKIRSSLPEEVGRAKLIAKDQERMIRAAQEKAQSIVTEATSKHEEMLDEHEIVQRARTTADVILREAEERARKVREGADQYAAQLLGELEGRLSNALGSVRKGREALAPRPTQPAKPAQPLAEAAAKSKRAAFDAQAADDTAALDPVELVK